MSIIAVLTEWTIKTFSPLGIVGLFILSFIESSFFPVPPDILLLVLILEQPAHAFWFATICTIASVLGGIFGYGIGRVGERVVLEKLFKHDKIERVHKLFNKYGAWAVFMAAFTPIPYKVFTVGAGVFYINFKKFIIASIIGRGLRFYLVAFLIVQYGEAIMDFLTAYELPLLIVSVIILCIGFLFYQHKKKKRITSSAAQHA